MLKVLVIGSGAREHAIVWKLLLSRKVKDVYVAPGNGGTALIARNLDVSANDIKGLADAALERGINLVVVGPEDPLSHGIVDHFNSLGIPTFGPTREAAQIEASKSFAKDLMQKYGIPCARGATFSSYEEARYYAANHPLPVVIKADGLAAGKGVTVARTYEDAFRALDEIMVRGAFGEAGSKVVIDECLVGPEVSLLCFTDGKTVLPMVPACDYKRVFDGDEGPNTGGMGCYSPPGFFGPEMVEAVKRTILEPTVRGLAAEGITYRGVLYAGLMITAEGPKVIEFNCRFGDPETQAILPRLKTELVDIIQATIQGTLDQLQVEWSDDCTVGVVLASGGYPGSYLKGQVISGLESLDDDIRIFHAGTRLEQRSVPIGGAVGLLPGKRLSAPTTVLVTDGGRVLTVVASGPTMETARRKVYANVRKVQFSGCHFRTDIAAREILANDGGSISPSPVAVAAAPRPAENPEAEELLSLAERLLAEGKDRQAIDTLMEALSLQPDHSAARAKLGTAYAIAGELGLAIEQWAELAKSDRPTAEARHNLGSLYLRQGRIDLAMEELTEAVKLEPTYTPALLGIGAILAKRGQYSKAVSFYETAMRVDPTSAEAHLDFAIVLLEMSDRSRAMAELKACMESNPDPQTRQEAEQIQKQITKKGWF